MTSKPEQPPVYPFGADEDTRPPLLPVEEEPPAYEQEVPLSPDDILPPTTFVLHGRFIYPCPSSSSLGQEGSSEPAYQLSRAIHMQGTATQLIEFERVDYKFKASRTGNLIHTKRVKSLYNLEYHIPQLSMNWQALAKPTSRRTLGEVYIEKPMFLHPGYRAYKILSEEQEALIKKKPGNPPKKEWYFGMRQVDKEQQVWEWKDANGNVLARQWRDKGKEEMGKDEFRLEVVTEVSRRVMDSLVALWCLWLWHLHIVDSRPKKTWHDRKAILEKKRPDLQGLGNGFLGYK